MRSSRRTQLSIAWSSSWGTTSAFLAVSKHSTEERRKDRNYSHSALLLVQLACVPPGRCHTPPEQVFHAPPLSDAPSASTRASVPAAASPPSSPANRKLRCQQLAFAAEIPRDICSESSLAQTFRRAATMSDPQVTEREDEIDEVEPEVNMPTPAIANLPHTTNRAPDPWLLPVGRWARRRQKGQTPPVAMVRRRPSSTLGHTAGRRTTARDTGCRFPGQTRHHFNTQGPRRFSERGRQVRYRIRLLPGCDTARPEATTDRLFHR